MELKKVSVDRQTFDKVVHYDQSITHWAMEHARASASAADAMRNYQDLHHAKGNAIAEICKEAGLDLSRVSRLQLTGTGDECFLEVILHDAPTASPPGTEPAVEASSGS